MMERKNWKPEFAKRFDARYDELKWLYCELYHNHMDGLDWLCGAMYDAYTKRSEELKRQDRRREKSPDWYRRNDLLGMMLYVDAFAGNLSGVKEKLPYIKSCGVNYLHLMPLLDSPKGRDDGGYAVADFRKVRPELGTMEELEELTAECRRQRISCCLDFVMNHTSEDHAWAKAARAGDPEARSRYFFYDNWDIPKQFEETMPEVFPTTAPGNFTWLEDCRQVVMTTFYPYQWDLNYGNSTVFNDMTCNMLYLANRGIDVMRLDAVPYIWKELGTSCRNHPKVHTIVRMMRLVCEIVCPGVLLLGEVVMEPARVVPYFGTVEKPECHMLYNVTTMASTWNTVATKDVALLKRQMDQVSALPKDYVFLNYLRCHDDIGWGLDYDWLSRFEIDEAAHKKYLNDYLTGQWPGSDARGELYNNDPRLKDARLCGTTASLSGLEAALYENDAEKTEKAVRLIEMLHAWLFVQSGIPVLYSGDEVGALNDYSYKEDPYKKFDSRYLHRGRFPWELTEGNAVSGRIFESLRNMETLRAAYGVFFGNAAVSTFDTGNSHVLGVLRKCQGQELYALFNFNGSEEPVQGIPEGSFKELISGREEAAAWKTMPGYGAWWLFRETKQA